MAQANTFLTTIYYMACSSTLLVRGVHASAGRARPHARAHTVRAPSRACMLRATLHAWCTMRGCTQVINKVAVYHIPAPSFLLFCQLAVSALACQLGGALRIIEVRVLHVHAPCPVAHCPCLLARPACAHLPLSGRCHAHGAHCRASGTCARTGARPAAAACHCTAPTRQLARRGPRCPACCAPAACMHAGGCAG